MSEQLANNMIKSMIQGTLTYMNLENRCIGTRLNPGKSLEMETRFATYQEKVQHLNNHVLRTVQSHFNSQSGQYAKYGVDLNYFVDCIVAYAQKEFPNAFIPPQFLRQLKKAQQFKKATQQQPGRHQ